MLRLGVAASAIALVVLVAGCGDETSDAEGWADSFCSNVNAWAMDLRGIAGDLQDDPSSVTVAGIRTAVARAQDATETFAGELRDLGPPREESGDAIEREMQSLAARVERIVDDVRDDVSGQNGNLFGALTAVSSGIAEASKAVATSLTKIGEAGSDELADALRRSQQCADVRDQLVG